jgi:threonine aldolase
VVNLYSDTQTRPTAAMRRAMADAEVGDEQSFLDPTVNALCERAAELLGQEAAVFLPSGTMCNAIAFRLHVRPGGDEVVLHRTSHPIIAEAGGPAAISGAVLCPVEGERGMFDADTLRSMLRPAGDRYTPRSRLVSLEQTTNIAGGRVWPPEQMEGVLEVARGAGMRAHLDGARLMNAVVASGLPAAKWAGRFDTAWLDFTKGLGAPVGAVLAGSAELIEEAWRYKQMWGGALRQAGIIAAAGMYALDHHVERLADDHENAAVLARGLAEIDGVSLDPGAVETNIVVFEVPDAPAFCAALEGEGVRMGALGPQRVRAVTHLDVDRAGVERAIAAARVAIA